MERDSIESVDVAVDKAGRLSVTQIVVTEKRKALAISKPSKREERELEGALLGRVT